MRVLVGTHGGETDSSKSASCVPGGVRLVGTWIMFLLPSPAEIIGLDNCVALGFWHNICVEMADKYRALLETK